MKPDSGSEYIRRDQAKPLVDALRDILTAHGMYRDGGHLDSLTRDKAIAAIKIAKSIGL